MTGVGHAPWEPKICVTEWVISYRTRIYMVLGGDSNDLHIVRHFEF